MIAFFSSFNHQQKHHLYLRTLLLLPLLPLIVLLNYYNCSKYYYCYCRATLTTVYSNCKLIRLKYKKTSTRERTVGHRVVVRTTTCPSVHPQLYVFIIQHERGTRGRAVLTDGRAACYCCGGRLEGGALCGWLEEATNFLCFY